MPIPVNTSDTSVFNSAFELLKEWMDIEDADDFQPLGNATVYKTSVVLWLMLFQRLNPRASLREAVEYFFTNAPRGKNANKRLREGSLSPRSSAYSDARKRLTLEVVEWFQNRLSNSIIESTPPSFNNQRVFLIDGTTLPGAPSPALQKAFPPASNQHGEGVWPVIHLVAAHELSSGAALPPEIGAMYGEHAIAETRLADPLIARLPERSIVMADAGFGIYSVALAAKNNGHNLVLRLTKQRFDAYKKKATLLDSTPAHRIYDLEWTPSDKDRDTNPSIPADSTLRVKLYELKIGEEWLFLVTDLTATPKAFKDLYFQRNHVEIDIRNIKVVFKTEGLTSKSVAMFRKELGMAMVAYNLTSQLRRQASFVANCTPRELSFTGVWNVYRHHLQSRIAKDATQWHAQFEIALQRASLQMLTKRPGRSFPREAYPRRSKTTRYQKRKKPEKPSKSEEAKPK